jgi:hypothetical protein
MTGHADPGKACANDHHVETLVAHSLAPRTDVATA